MLEAIVSSKHKGGFANMNMLGMRRKNNRNGVMWSLVGLGVGAAAYGMMRGRNNNMNLNPNNMMKQFQNTINQTKNPLG